MPDLPEKQAPEALNLFQAPQDPQAFKETMTRGPTSSLLQFIILQTHNSGLVKDQTSPVKAGEFTIGPAAYNLGSAFLAVVGPWRPHARYMVNKVLQAESFDAESPEFEKIVQSELELHAASKKGHIARTGIDVLFWVPERKVFGSYFITATAKAEADELPTFQGKVITVGCREVVTNVNSWHVPSFTLVESPPDLELPRAEDLERAMKAFSKGAAASEKKGPDAARPR